MFMTLLKGTMLGFLIAAPVGPIGVLCIRRTLSQGRLYGLVSGLGAAMADVIFGCIAAFGLTFITQFMLDQQSWIKLIGGIFLCVLGIKCMKSKPEGKPAPSSKSGLLKAFISTFLLTLSNPITIILFLGLFAALGLSQGGSTFSGYVLVLGVFIGSVFWWLLLSLGIGWFRKFMNDNFLVWLNRISGSVLICFGGYIFVDSFI
ncbi:LysE family translocator [Paenibacillus sp. 481]|uniref:LysE family translocator n=1 Tax=Paenibacillus sp. 481 TaxID=2835869 RepID=UPI001E493BE8|nr:LysE family translocator [Paenibacillus sp. 481]UHA72686.1 LysE family translocator [Paenibacillus sp. 481]